jgi:endonuclease YncB( thermonuclease family)
MGLGQWIIIIVLVAIIIFGFAAVFNFGKGVFNAYPLPLEDSEVYLISKVVKVIDGDTIDLASGERIRMSIVNTPERGQEGYQDAKGWTAYRCLDKEATIDLDAGQLAGSYNRAIGAVYCGNIGDSIEDKHFINYELIDLGLGVVMTNFCKVSEFAKELCP